MALDFPDQTGSGDVFAPAGIEPAWYDNGAASGWLAWTRLGNKIGGGPGSPYATAFKDGLWVESVPKVILKPAKGAGYIDHEIGGSYPWRLVRYTGILYFDTSGAGMGIRFSPSTPANILAGATDYGYWGWYHYTNPVTWVNQPWTALSYISTASHQYPTTWGVQFQALVTVAPSVVKQVQIRSHQINSTYQYLTWIVEGTVNGANWNIANSVQTVRFFPTTGLFAQGSVIVGELMA